jgi:hypothetical protein
MVIGQMDLSVVIRYANGKIYVGTWVKGLKDGKGTF